MNWSKGETIILCNISRSDGKVSTATPALCLEDSEKYLAVYIPKDAPFKGNYFVTPDKRVKAVEASATSAQRSYKDLVWWRDTVRLYLLDVLYSVWFFYNDRGAFSSYYGNLEVPFVKTSIGADTRDYALDIVANAQGRWQWKDETEFAKRLAWGLILQAFRLE